MGGFHFTKVINSTPLLRGGSRLIGAGVLAFTAGGTAPEFRRFAIHLSPWSPLGTPLPVYSVLKYSIAQKQQEINLKNKHSITEAIKTVALSYGFGISTQKELFTDKSCDEHEWC